MMTSRTTLLGIFLAMAVSVLMLIFLSWLAYDRIQEYGRRTEPVNHTYRVRVKNNELLAMLANVETGYRGYLLSGNEKFLRTYAAGRQQLKAVKKALGLLVRDDPTQRRRLDTLNVLIDKNMLTIEAGISRKKAGFSMDMAALDEGHAYMNEIRAVAKRLDQDERKVLEYRAALQRNADKYTNYYVVLLSIVSLSFLLLFFRLLYIELRRRISFQQTLEEKLTDLERANAELEQFAYVASHDLQEPLRKIRAFGERLALKQREYLNEDGKANLVKINQSAVRMQQLIDDLLVFSRTANLRERIFEEINLNDILTQAKEELSNTIQKKNATIISEVLPTVQGVKFQMVQLFNNLISNALKYSHEEVVPIVEIDYEQVDGKEIENAGYLQRENIYHRISFIDNGIGFDPVYAEKIFVIFQRLHNRSEYEGTGIGLALCRRIVTNHNGFITAEANPGQTGAVFHVYLPKG